MTLYKHIVLHLVGLGVCCVIGCAYSQPHDSNMDNEVDVMIKLALLCSKNNIKMYVQPCANRYCEPMIFLKVAPACVYLPPCEAWGTAQAEGRLQKHPLIAK